MFGYIRTDTPEMRVRENEYYRAVYCGLCRAQGKCTGQCSRMTLSYDFVFLALLRIAVSKERIEFSRGRCIAHPFKKRAYVVPCDPLFYTAYASALLVYGKNKDDLSDERGVKRLKAKLLKPFTKHMRKKVPKEYASLDALITEGLRRLSEIEKEKQASVDLPANCFGNILGDLLSFGLEHESAVILRNIGNHVGRWIYILDAVDDLEEDLDRNRFNPFACLYDGQLLTEEQRREIADSLKLELMASEPAFDLLDFEDHPDIEGIVKNILYRGMPNVADRVLALDSKRR